MGTVSVKSNGTIVKGKAIIDYMQAPTLSRLLSMINTHNMECPNTPILKDDIVDIIKEGEAYVLLYYK